MALYYNSGRVSRFSVGVPGFSTERDLVLDVSGAVGVGTTQPRAAADFPNVSVRSTLLDRIGFAGSLGYYLCNDANGVRWVEAPPINANSILVFDDDLIVGLGSFTGLNFLSKGDPGFVKISPNPGNPNLADIKFDNAWVRTASGGLATGFGPDGTYASATGITSVGIGTNDPQDDFQVGIGSTGVTINGALGLVDAEIIRAKNISVEGNLEVESLVVRPGFATVAYLDVDNYAIIPEARVGFASIKDAIIGILTTTELYAGRSILGIGSAPTDVLGDLYVRNGIGSFSYDVFVGRDLTVEGTVFFRDLESENILVTGVGTINSLVAVGAAFTDLFVTGITTLNTILFNDGVGANLDLFSLDAVTAGITTIFSQEITTEDIVVTGIASVGFLTVTDGFIQDISGDNINFSGIATIGSLEINGDQSTFTNVLVTGVSTFVGVGTFLSDLYVGNDLFVNGDVTFDNINGNQLVISGVGTIVDLVANTGVITALSAETADIGFATITSFESQVGVISYIQGTDITAGVITSFDIVTDRLSVGILTGDLLNLQFGIGTITDFTSDVAYIGVATGSNLDYTGLSTIAGTEFDQGDVRIPRNLYVAGLSTFVGVGTFVSDLYVGEDLYVQGTVFFKQIETENLRVSGVGTIIDLEVLTGFATYFEFENINVTGIATINNLIGTAATITTINGTDLNISNVAVINQQITNLLSITDTAFINQAQVGYNLASRLNVTGIGTLANADIGNANIDFAQITDEIVGTSTITRADITLADIADANILDLEVRDLLVTGITTFQGVVNIDDVAFINAEVTGIATITNLYLEFGVVDLFNILEEVVGISTVGVLSVTRTEATHIDVYTINAGIITTRQLFVEDLLTVNGPSTFTGITTFNGDVFVDGDLSVTGVVSFLFLAAETAQIGVLTAINLDVDYINAGITTTQNFVSVGVATFQDDIIVDGDLIINNNLNIVGILTAVNFDLVGESIGLIGFATITNSDTVGTATFRYNVVQDELVGTSTVTRLDATFIETDELLVTGVSTFQDTVNIDFLAEITNANIGTEFVNQSNIFEANIQNEYVGFSSVGFATITEAFIGVITNDDLQVTGFGTIGNVTIGNGTIEVEFLNVTGIATMNQTDVTDGFATNYTIENAYIDNAFIDDTQTNQLLVIGLSTFVGFTTFQDDVVIRGDLDVFGFVSFTKLTADEAIIGIATITTLDNEYFTSGVATFSGNIEAPSGQIDYIESLQIINAGNFDSGGIATVGQDMNVGRNLFAAGLSTFIGVATFFQDVYIAGDLYVRDDIFKDEINGRNANFTGIVTANQLDVDTGTIDVLDGTDLTYQNGNISSITAYEIYATKIETGDINATGLSTFVGISSFASLVNFYNNVNIGGNLDVTGDIAGNNGNFDATVTADDFQGQSGTIFILDSTTITSQDINNSNTVTSTAFNGVYLNITGVGTINQFYANSSIVSGLSSSQTLYVDLLANVEDLIVRDQLQVFGNADFAGDVLIQQDLTVLGTTNLTDISVRNVVSTGIATMNYVEANAIDTILLNVSGIATFGSNVFIAGIAAIDTQVRSPSGIITALSGSNLNYETGTFSQSLTTLDFTATRNAQVLGILTATDVNIPNTLQVGNSVNVTGILTSNQIYGTTLDVSGSGFINALDFVTITGNSGIITALQIEYANILETTIGIATITYANINQETVALSTVTNADIATADITTANIDTANITTENTTTANIDVANIVYANITEEEVGLSTVSFIDIIDGYANRLEVTQLNHDQVSATIAFSATTNSVVKTPLVSLDATVYRSFEYKIQATEGTNYHATMIHAIHDGATAYANEYSTVFNNNEVALYDVDYNLGNVILSATAASANLTNYLITIVATRV